jgi:Raf kinase inhibitor-like YbhB/YbcL family protein
MLEQAAGGPRQMPIAGVARRRAVASWLDVAPDRVVALARRPTAVVVAALSAWACACGGGEPVEGPPPRAPATMTVRSTAFADGGRIPRVYTCSGRGLAPPLRWSGVPRAARALALVMEDPDAPGGTFLHWVVIDLPPDVAALRGGTPPPPARALENSFGERGYGGPCPPEGDAPHRYVFRVYALDAPLRLDPGTSPGDARTAIARHAIAGGRLTGRFGR